MANNNLGSGLIAVLAGAALGAAAGILLAPEKGSKLRRRIKHGVSKESDNLLEKIEDLKCQITGKVKEKTNDFEDSFNKFVDEAGDKTDDVIANLEKKLKELKGKAEKKANNL